MKFYCLIYNYNDPVPTILLTLNVLNALILTSLILGEEVTEETLIITESTEEGIR